MVPLDATANTLARGRVGSCHEPQPSSTDNRSDAPLRDPSVERKVLTRRRHFELPGKGPEIRHLWQGLVARLRMSFAARAFEMPDPEDSPRVAVAPRLPWLTSFSVAPRLSSRAASRATPVPGLQSRALIGIPKPGLCFEGNDAAQPSRRSGNNVKKIRILAKLRQPNVKSPD